MLVKNIKEAIIYEGLDGSEAVFTRYHGGAPNKLTDEESKILREKLDEDMLWFDVRLAAKTNPSLQRALEEALLIYNLSK
jgi:transposase